MTLLTLTFGCRLNAAESLAMQARAAEAGLKDAILVNTCAVTAEAVRQARQAIRKARREHPGKPIVVSGCAAQIEPAAFAQMPEVDLVLGNAEKLRAESYRELQARTGLEPDVVMPGLDPGIHSVTPGAGREHAGTDRRMPDGDDGGGRAVALPDFGIATSERIHVSDIFSVRETAAHLAAGFAAPGEGRARAFVEVQNGCDHRCTFCVIPYGRGDSRSVPIDILVRTIQRLADTGIREVVLTGVDITAYGADLPGAPTLGALVRSILKHVPELPRLRLSSIDSVEADAELLHTIAEEERLMPHLHLSLQSGDDLILKRMKRRHSRADAIRFCDKVRDLRPDIVFGADLIAGFPTESDTMFENTLSLVGECGLTFLHVFPFSARPGTPAARMPSVPPSVVHARAGMLRLKGHAALSAFLASEVGKTRRVLVEKPGLGHTEHYAPATVDRGAVAGMVVPIRVVGADAGRLAGISIQEAA